MKTIKVLFTVLAVAIVAIASAVENPQMHVTPIAADRAVVSIINQKPAYFELSVKAANGETVYYKLSNKEISNFQKVFDFKNLENGNYTMNLKINDTLISKELEVASNRIKVGESKVSFDPYFVFEGNQLKFSFLNFEEENFKVYVLKNKKTVFESKVGNDFALSSGYDFSNLEDGNYQVILSSISNEFVYSIEK